MSFKNSTNKNQIIEFYVNRLETIDREHFLLRERFMMKNRELVVNLIIVVEKLRDNVYGIGGLYNNNNKKENISIKEFEICMIIKNINNP